MLTGIFSFLGIIIGASLQYLFTKHIENKRHLRDLRSKAYMDYLKCVCEQAQHLYMQQSHEYKELFARTADSKARICLYGSNSAIKAFSIFEKLGASMKTNESKQAFISMVAIMRTDSGSELGAEAIDIQNVILGVRK